MGKIIDFRVCFKRDTLERWIYYNPILLDGEVAVVYCDGYNKIKVGDGISHFNDLEYVADSEIMYKLTKNYDILNLKINLLSVAFIIHIIINSFLSIIGG